MSAFICNDDLFDLLTTADGVRAAYQGKVTPPAEVQAFFDMLRQTNYDSVNFRYSENESPEPRMFRRVLDFRNDPSHLLQVLRSISVYEYQSCEHRGWATSDAYRAIVNLGEWIDDRLENEHGWVKQNVSYGGGVTGEEWLGIGLGFGDWDRSRGWPDLSEFTPERLAALRKLRAAEADMLNNPNIRRIL